MKVQPCVGCGYCCMESPCGLASAYYMNEWNMENAQYWPDDAHPECSKHCWTCGKCGKIVQVG